LYGTGGGSNLDPPVPEDDENIIAALKQSTRVSSISLTITSSLIKKLFVISEPISELEDLSLLSQDNLQLTLPTTFRWGPRLRTLHSVRIAFPSLPRLLSPCQGIIDLQVHEIPSAGYFSPEAFASALSGMAQLRTLSLHFLSLPPRRNFLGFPPHSGERVVLPSLTCLKYRGTSKYLDSLVARIDAPHLGDIDITFFFQPTIDASHLGRFVERIEVRTSLSQATIETSAHSISISVSQPGTSTPLKLQISCKQLDWQLSCMAQVCDQFSPFLFRVEALRINTTQSSIGQDDMGEHWVDLVRSFGGTRDLWMANELTMDILRTLGQADGGQTTVLPALRRLHVEKPMEMDVPSCEALDSFMTSRSLSDCPVKCNVLLFQCHVCQAHCYHQTRLYLHLIRKHMFRVVCSYCKVFVSMPGNDNLFWCHLVMNHPQVSHKDELLSNPLLAYPSALEFAAVRRRHSSLIAPDMVASSTTTAEPHSQ
jgi:hypothetical protein